MRNVIWALAISIGASVLLYLSAVALGLAPDLAKGLAGLPAFATKNIYEFLEVNKAKRALNEVGSESIVSLEEFSLKPIFAFLLSSVMFSGVLFITGGLIGLLEGIAYAFAHKLLDVHGNDGLIFANIVVFCSFPLRIIAAIYLGRWIGSRCPRHGFVIGVAATVAGGLIAFTISQMFLITEQDMQMLFNRAKTTQSMLIALFELLPDFIIYSVFVSVGVYLGKRRRFSRYLTFILGLLSSETRRTIVEMARDEALRTAHEARPAA